MNTPFRTERVFHDSRGWYVSMRPSDARVVRRLPVPGHHIEDHGLVVGPFVERVELEKWFANFVGRHGATRLEDRVDRAA